MTSNRSSAMTMLQKIFDPLLCDLSDDDLDALFAALALERARRRNLRCTNPEVITA
jgi:hypothetical protein